MTGADCLIFIPTYNEAGNVEVLFDRIQRLNLGSEVLFLDDNSPDGTGKILDRLAAKHPRLRVIHRAGKLGIGSAHAEAIEWACRQGYATLITMDSDFTHSPESIPALLAARSDFDLVVGSRHLQENSLRGWTLLRRFLTKLAHILTRLMLGMPYDATSSFRCYRLDRIPREAFRKVKSPGYSFFMESLFVLWSNGVSIGETPLRLSARAQGSSKMRLRDAWDSLRTLLRLFLTRLG